MHVLRVQLTSLVTSSSRQPIALIAQQIISHCPNNQIRCQTYLMQIPAENFEKCELQLSASNTPLSELLICMSSQVVHALTGHWFWHVWLCSLTHRPRLGACNVHRPHINACFLLNLPSAGFLNCLHLLHKAAEARQHAGMPDGFGSAQQDFGPIHRFY